MLETIDDQTVSLQKMAELMRYRTGKVPESLSTLLPKPKEGQQPFEAEYPFHIDKINRKTGYMQMSRKGAEGTITMTYWNIDKSRKLIGTAYSLCTMICEVGSLSFSLYKDGKFESYNPIEGSEDVLDTKYFLQDRNNTAALKRDSAVLQFSLPEKGTDIIISLDGVFDEEGSFKNNYRFGCVKLVWQKKKGSFMVQPTSGCK